MKKEKKRYFVDIPHYLYQHLSGLELMVYMVIRVHNPKPTCNKAKLFRRYGISPASGRKALARLLEAPVPRGLAPGKIYITKCTTKERHDGPQQKIVTGEACTAAVPMLRNLGERYEFPHDYQQDDTYAKAKVYYKRWHQENLATVAKRRTERGISWPCMKLFFVVHSFMSFQGQANGACYASHTTIAQRAGLSPSSRDKVCKQLKKLVQKDMFVQGYTGASNGKVTAAYFPNNRWFERGVARGLVTSRPRTLKDQAEGASMDDILERIVRGVKVNGHVLSAATGRSAAPNTTTDQGELDKAA